MIAAGEGATPSLSAKSFELYGLLCLLFVFSGLVPIWRFASGTNSRFPHCALSGYPLVGAAGAFIPLLLEDDQCHVKSNILTTDILSREAGGRALIPKKRFWVVYPCGFVFCKGGVFLLLFSNFQFLFSICPLAGRVLIPKKRRWCGCILLTVFKPKKEIPA